MNDHARTARHIKIISPDGIRYRFFCESSGAAVAMSGIIREKDEERALMIAWEESGRQHLNLCRRCGRWVCNAMYNADVLECADCAPWEEQPRFCPSCGTEVGAEYLYCERCGALLRYGGKNDA